jgi:hypothetical protein
MGSDAERGRAEGGGQVVGGGSEEAAVVSQDRRGGRKSEALGGIARLVEQRLGFGPFIHLDIDRQRWIIFLNG